MNGAGTARVKSNRQGVGRCLQGAGAVLIAGVNDDATQGGAAPNHVEAVEEFHLFEAGGDGGGDFGAPVVDEESGASYEGAEGSLLAELGICRLLPRLIALKLVIAREKRELVEDDGRLGDVDLGVSGSFEAFGAHVVAEFGAGLVAVCDEENGLVGRGFKRGSRFLNG